MFNLQFKELPKQDVFDIYDIIEPSVELGGLDYYLHSENGWCWSKKNNDAVLNGSFKIDNRDGSHIRIGSIGRIQLNLHFTKGKLSLFSIYDNKFIVCWEILNGKSTLCNLERLMVLGQITGEDAAYLRMKYEYHANYYTNINNA